mmetsp:Transcript_6350/g.11787  ORF Transcript_6350/g.11787 Transcript_6350/m.11787 type:complete len:118 (+) Transcript_6350:2103-2456(+)
MAHQGPWQEAIPLSQVKMAKLSWNQLPHRCLLMQCLFKLDSQMSQDIRVRRCLAALVPHTPQPQSKLLEPREPTQCKELRCLQNLLSQDILVRRCLAALVPHRPQPQSKLPEPKEPR